jgi:hypothetical protein
MNKIDLIGKSDLEMIDIITKAERTVEKLHKAKKSSGLKKSKEMPGYQFQRTFPSEVFSYFRILF